MGTPQSIDDESAPTFAAHAPPDWDRVETDLTCPLCDYNLRGLVEPRCPECGYRFQWAKLIRAREEAHDYLFEHHPKRNAWSFVRTYIGSLRPTKFWKNLHPAQPSRPGRLLVYWVLASVTVALGFALVAAADGIRWTTLVQRYGADWWSILVHCIVITFRQIWRKGQTMEVMAMILLWPWLSLAALSVFRISMERRRVRTVQVMRCCLYGGDYAAWLGLVLALAMPVMRDLARDMHEYMDDELLFFQAASVIALVTWYRIGRAYQIYLKFDKPFLTVLSAQVMLFLLAMIVILSVQT